MASKAFTLFLAMNLVALGTASACAPNCSSTPTPSSSSYDKCPKDTLKLAMCTNVLGLIKAEVGKPPPEPCCPLLEGLVDLEAAVCLCTAIKANILGISLDVSLDLSLILNYCGKTVPTGFKCG